MSLKPQIIRGNELTLDTFYAALQSLVPPSAMIAADGTLYTQPDLLKKVDAARQPFKTYRDAKTASNKALADLKVQRPSIKRLVKALQVGIKGFLGEGNPEMIKFGFKPDKTPTPLTSEQKAKKAAKSRATRAKNGTLGPKQKKALDAGQNPAAGPTSPSVTGNGGK